MFGTRGHEVHQGIPVLRVEKDTEKFQEKVYNTGQIVRRITGALRGKKNESSFWLRPAWKRIVHWGRDFFNLQRYIYQNRLEILGPPPLNA